MASDKDDGLGQIAFGVLGLLRCGAHRVIAKDGEEHGRCTGGDAAEAVGNVRREVVRIDEEYAHHDDSEHDCDLHEHQPGLYPDAALDAAVEQPCHSETEQHREEAHAVTVTRARGPSIHAGRSTPTACTRKEMYCDTPRSPP